MRKIKAAVALLTLAVCAAYAEEPAKPMFESRPASHRAPDTNEGMAIVSMTTNAGLIDGVDVLVVDSETAQYTLRSVSSAYARDTVLFVGVLPEGVYNIKGWEERDAFRKVTVPEKQQQLMGTFEVRRGQPCDLGRLVTTQIAFAYGTGRSATITENREALLQFAPDSARLFPDASSSCWSKARDEKDVTELYARSYPVGAAMVAELPDGRVAIPSGMGSVLLRGADGQWSVARSAGMQRLLWLESADRTDAQLIAVGEMNAILRLDRDGTLQPMPAGELPMGSILFLDGNATAGWHIVHQRGSQLKIYRTDSLELPVWTEIASSGTGFSAWSGAKNFWVWPTAQGFAYAVTDKGTMRFYDYASRTWTERHTPKENPFIGIAHSPGDVIGILTSPGGGFGGITASHYYSRDYGQTWIDIPSSPYSVKVSPPRVLPDNTLLVNGGVFGDGGLQASKDGGKTWTKLSDKIEVGDFYWNLPHAGLFNVSKSSLGIEMISHSGDGGTTWSTEYMSVNRELIRRQMEEERAAEEAKKAARAAKRKTKR